MECKFKVGEKLTALDVPICVGDVLVSLEYDNGVAVGSEDTVKDVDNTSFQGAAFAGHLDRSKWRFVKRPTELIMGTDNPEIHKGDTVMLLDYGWGIGPSCNVALGEPMVVESASTNYALVHTPHGKKSVNKPALRVIKSTKETPVKLPKASLGCKSGNVYEYLDLKSPASITDQKKHANRVIREMKRKHTGQIWVVGGAPRNWDHNKLANDIDVYMFLGTSNPAEAQSLLAARLGIQSDDITRLGEGNPYKYAGNNIKFVFDVTLAGQQYQFIIARKPILEVEEDVMSHFNCDLCKIAHDAITGETVRTIEYKTDRDFKRLTYRMYTLSESNARMSMEKHVPKMMRQFPEHTVVIMQADPDAPVAIAEVPW